jgi:hypothetical protein
VKTTVYCRERIALFLCLILTDGEGAIPDIPAVSNALGFLSLHQEVGERYKHQV